MVGYDHIPALVCKCLLKCNCSWVATYVATYICTDIDETRSSTNYIAVVVCFKLLHNKCSIREREDIVAKISITHFIYESLPLLVILINHAHKTEKLYIIISISRMSRHCQIEC